MREMLSQALRALQEIYMLEPKIGYKDIERNRQRLARQQVSPRVEG